MKAAYVSLLLAMILGACNNGATEADSSQPVPLPRAWPRTNLYPEVYASVSATSDIETVSGLDVAERTTPDGYNWIDIRYPAYRATLYLTDARSTSEEKNASAHANRMERMALNSGGRPSEEISFETPAGYRAVVLSTPSGSLTPLQFVATGPLRVVSGAFTLDRVPHSADSLAPTLRAARRDIIHLIKSLK